MSPTKEQSEKEQLTALVYGDTFALYDEASFDEFVQPLYRRLESNGISTDVFKGKRCLDAGCGGGRGTILMAQSGAAEVVAVDLSEQNVESTRKRAAQKGLSNVTLLQRSLMELDLPEESFDVVWCNGVLHHTADPDRGLVEITRRLRTGGHLWLYLYGSGGLYWHVMYWIRGVLAGVDVRRCIFVLRLMGAPVRRIAEWIDDWFVPYLRAYTADDVTRRLEELGYEQTDVLRYGVHYDTSQRRADADDTEAALMGEGDLRFFCTKVRAPSGNEHPLPDPPHGRGSDYETNPVVAQVDPALERIEQGLRNLEAVEGGDGTVYRILAARRVHETVRGVLETEGPVDMPGFLARLTEIAEHIEGLSAAPRKP